MILHILLLVVPSVNQLLLYRVDHWFFGQQDAHLKKVFFLAMTVPTV